MRRGKPAGPQQPQSLEDSILAAVQDVERSGTRGKRRDAARRKRKQVTDLFRGWKAVVVWVLGILVVFVADGVRREYKEFGASPSDISGTVQVLKHGETAPVTLTAEERLHDDDLVITGPKSMVTLLFPDGSAVQVEPETRFQVRLLDFERGGRRDRSFMVESGAIVTHVSQFFGAKSQATVCTPTAVAAVRGTSFRVSFDPTTQASSVHVVDGMVEMRTPRLKENVIPGQVSGTLGYDARGTETMNADLVRRLSLRTEQLKIHEEPPGAVDSFEAKLTNLADPILQLMGIVPGSWGYNGIEFARRTGCMEALRRLRMHIEELNTGRPEVLNPVTLVEIGLDEVEQRRILNGFQGRMLESYTLNPEGAYVVRARARDKRGTLYQMTAAEIIKIPPGEE